MTLTIVESGKQQDDDDADADNADDVVDADDVDDVDDVDNADFWRHVFVTKLSVCYVVSSFFLHSPVISIHDMKCWSVCTLCTIYIDQAIPRVRLR